MDQTLPDLRQALPMHGLASPCCIVAADVYEGLYLLLCEISYILSDCSRCTNTLVTARELHEGFG